MKAAHLTRKTHFKKHTHLPAQEATFYDMTAEDVLDADIEAQTSILSLCKDPENQYKEIIALPYGFATEADVLAWCAAVLFESPTGKALMQDVAKRGWTIGLSDLQSGGFYMDVPKKCLLLDHFSMMPSALGRSVYFRNAILTTFVRALRDIWHEERGCVFEKDYGPEDILMLERIRAADCDTTAILVGWELRGAGYTDVWRHLLGTEEGDMAMVFSQFLERDPSASFNGSALAYAFRQWYADDSRVDGSDHETLENLDDLIMDAMETGAKPFGEETLRPALIEEMSVLPDGICYLAGLGRTIKDDPFFAGMHDPINQSHLFHLIYDMEVTIVNNVPFRDKNLASMIFPNNTR